MCLTKAGGCLPFFPSPWHKSFWNSPHPSMYNAIEPFPCLGHSLHRLVVFVCWFVSKLLSHYLDLAHLLFCWSSSNHLPHPAAPRRYLIFAAHCTSFPARLLPCVDCLICAVTVAPLGENIFASNRLVCLDVGFFMCRFFSMRFYFDQKRRCFCVLFRSSLMTSRKMSASSAPTNVAFPPLPTHLFTAVCSAWLSHK